MLSRRPGVAGIIRFCLRVPVLLYPIFLLAADRSIIDADIQGVGTELNGNYQFGIGLRLPYTDENDFVAEYRFHHISNGGREDPNDPLNSSKLLFGITF